MGVISVAQPFDLADVLDGTQDFRWCLRQDGWYSGVLDGNLLHARQTSDGLEYRAGNDPTDLLRRYFRLDDDLDAARAELAAVDARIGELVERYPSLRVLRQPDRFGRNAGLASQLLFRSQRTGSALSGSKRQCRL